MAVSPQRSLARAVALLEGPLPKKDPGLPGAMLLGLPRAAEAEPEAAEELCTALVREGGLDAAEALLSLRHERVGGDFGAWACQMARAALRERHLAESDDDGLAALAQALDQELRPVEEHEGSDLRTLLDDALTAFASEGARAAYGKAQGVLARVDATLRRLEAAPQATAAGRREAFLALRELDGALLERSILADLLMLGARGESTNVTAPLSGYFARLTEWLLAQERAPVTTRAPLTHRTLRIHRLRTLLHTVDADGSFGDPRAPELRDRRLRALDVLLGRVAGDVPSPLSRVITAAAARAGDAALREEIGELSDIFLSVLRRVGSIESLLTIAEASMVPDVESVFRAYAALLERTEHAARTTGTRARASLDALAALVRSFPAATSPRVDALHGALLAYQSAIEHLMAARSLAAVSGEHDGGGSRVLELERAVRLLERLAVGSRRRLGEAVADASGVAGPTLRVVDIAVERAYRGDREPLGEAIAAALDALHEDLPGAIAEVAATALVRMMSLPAEGRPERRSATASRPRPRKRRPCPRGCRRAAPWAASRAARARLGRGRLRVRRAARGGEEERGRAALRAEGARVHRGGRAHPQRGGSSSPLPRGGGGAARHPRARQPREARHLRRGREAQAHPRHGAGGGPDARARHRDRRPRRLAHLRAARRNRGRARGDARGGRRAPRPQAVERDPARRRRADRPPRHSGARRLRARGAAPQAGVRDGELRRAGDLGAWSRRATSRARRPPTSTPSAAWPSSSSPAASSCGPGARWASSPRT
ncbi:MAG: hypothetical protein M5U28_44375 [Sandaracinaceae bacterium]|nr:hypothetical protein [Sandaracinaceae bacterium]